jgi:hypothetical protein
VIALYQSNLRAIALYQSNLQAIAQNPQKVYVTDWGMTKVLTIPENIGDE